MQITFYHCADNPITLDKTLTGATAAATLQNYEPVNDLEGSILVQSAREAYNYCKIGNKYYFIRSREKQTNGILRLYLREDVLMTHAASIKKSPGVVGRNAVWSDPDLYDPDLQRLQKTQSYMAKIGSAFSYSSDYILVTVG